MSPKESPQIQLGMASQQYCLKWNNHQLNLLKSFDRLLQSESFTDVTLACEGRSLRAHKVVLSACSNYFETLFEEHPDKSPIIILKDMKFEHVSQLVNFMYRGEINITQDMLTGLLRTAETLKVKGLAEVSGDQSGPSAAAAAAAAAAVAAAHQFTPIQHTFRIGGPVSHLVPSPVLSGPLTIPVSTPSLTPLAALLNPEMGFEEQRVNLLKRINMEDDIEPPAKYSKKEIKTEVQSGFNAMENHLTPIQPRSVETPTSQQNKSGQTKQNGQQGGTPKQKKQDVPLSPPQQVLAPIPSEITVNAHHELPDFLKGFQVFRLNDYLGFRTRQQFWEEHAVRRIMEGIKNKEIDMKSAAELLGVSYGTLYGRYREVFGYLKHAWVNKPNRSLTTSNKEKTIWSESRSQDVINQVLNKELSLTAAAVRLGVDYNTFFAHLTDNGKNQERVSLLTGALDKRAKLDEEECFLPSGVDEGYMPPDEEGFMPRDDEAFSGDDEDNFIEDMDKPEEELDSSDEGHAFENDTEMNGNQTEDMEEIEETEDDIPPEEGINDPLKSEEAEAVEETQTEMEETLVPVDGMETED